MTEQSGDTLLELIDCGVLGIDVIAHRRRQHGCTHLFGRLGHGVRAQIDHGQESGRTPIGVFTRVQRLFECTSTANWLARESLGERRYYARGA